jgi:hypothetical protein
VPGVVSSSRSTELINVRADRVQRAYNFDLQPANIFFDFTAKTASRRAFHAADCAICLRLAPSGRAIRYPLSTERAKRLSVRGWRAIPPHHECTGAAQWRTFHFASSCGPWLPRIEVKQGALADSFTRKGEIEGKRKRRRRVAHGGA